ncbi:MAG TPA: hypothetical protein VFU39_02225 [Sulfuricaulis sp.]|nr:hypothetical protein [Sulfuricaulis sp.]
MSQVRGSLPALIQVMRFLGQEVQPQLAAAVANRDVAHIPRVLGVIVEIPDGASI